MAPRTLNQPGNSSVEDTVFSNLDLDVSDLNGAGDQGGSDLDLDDGDDGSGFEQPVDDQGDQGGSQQLDDLRLTQTVDRGRQQQQGQQPQQRQPIKFDAKGNILGADGKVIAKAGHESRLYTDAHKARQQLSGAQAQVEDLNTRLNKAVELGRTAMTELETYKTREAQFQEFGLSAEDRISAFQLIQSLKKDTAGTLQKLLTRAAANGINVMGVNGQNNNNGFDAKSVADLVRQEIANGLKPLNQQSEAQAKRDKEEKDARESTAAIQTEVNTFFRINPDAVPYLPVFEKAMTEPQFKGMSLSHLWDKIQLNLARNPNQRRPNGQQQQNPRRGVPGGRQAPPSKPGQVAPVTDDYNTILNAVLDDAGVER